MKNPFVYSSDNKRYHTLAYHNKIVFGEKIFKAVVDAGFTCPNKDGTAGVGGCIFCGGGSGYFTDSPTVPVKIQLRQEIERIHRKNKNAKAIAYFQANTNTYADVKKLREIYFPVLSCSDIIGISIGTRADCLSVQVLDFLSELAEKTNLTVELGMQSVHDKTIRLINRGYSHDVFLERYTALKQRGIRTCIHIINGLPFESYDDMIETVRQTGLLRPDAVKLQLLHVISGTPLEKIYNDGAFRTLTMVEYIKTIAMQLEYLPPETVIERITGDGDKRNLIAPLWSTNKIAVLGGIDKLQAELDSFQGKKFTPDISSD
ncbi:MAG: TIGR01212 family radical SAM protein [Porcipelethomonas sp.]